MKRGEATARREAAPGEPGNAGSTLRAADATRPASLNTRALALIRELEARRAAAGHCRHCDGPIPCWSEFGDHAPGVRHTRRTLKQLRADIVTGRRVLIVRKGRAVGTTEQGSR